MKLDCIACMTGLLEGVSTVAIALSVVDQCQDVGVDRIIADLCPDHKRIHDTCRVAVAEIEKAELS